MAILVAAPGRVFGREELLDAVWGRDGFVEPRTVDVHVARLRGKFTAARSPVPGVETVRGWVIGSATRPARNTDVTFSSPNRNPGARHITIKPMNSVRGDSDESVDQSDLTLLVSGAGSRSRPAAQSLINGAGATFPYPIYSKWFDEYTKVDPEVQINYQSIGSGGGIRQITTRTVDFGATDGPMTDEQLKQAPAALIHIPDRARRAWCPPTTCPASAGSSSSRRTCWPTSSSARSPSGTIRRIVGAEPGRRRCRIRRSSLVHRSDGSGTTYIWVDYLSKVSPEWQQKVGRGTSVNWPVGLGGKGNEGVAGQVKNTPGALGYVELAYAMQNKLPVASIKNRGGQVHRADDRDDDGGRRAAPPRACRPTSACRSPMRRATTPIRSPASPGCSCTSDQPNEAKGQDHRQVPLVDESRGPAVCRRSSLRAAAGPGGEADRGTIKQITYQGKPVMAAR